jgi:hypothetical protein
MDSPAELITRAARYRALATGVTDEQTRAGLLELAEKYEARTGNEGRRPSRGTVAGGELPAEQQKGAR